MWPTFFQQIIIRKEKYGGGPYNAKILKAPINQITTGPYLDLSLYGTSERNGNLNNGYVMSNNCW